LFFPGLFGAGLAFARVIHWTPTLNRTDCINTAQKASTLSMTHLGSSMPPPDPVANLYLLDVNALVALGFVNYEIHERRTESARHQPQTGEIG
jgi:hypothetical protein